MTIRNNIITAVFNCSGRCTTNPLYQYDYGQILKIDGAELPLAYEVHFSNAVHGIATTQIGNADGVSIPDMYLTSGETVFAWLFLHTGETDGETEFLITIPVIGRAEPVDDPPTPEQQSVITETLAALNAAVDRAEEHEEAASGFADDAEASAEAAAASATASAESAAESADSADRAEQAAAVAGFMYFHIDEHGHVIYERTDNVDIDFELENGRMVAIWQ